MDVVVGGEAHPLAHPVPVGLVHRAQRRVGEGLVEVVDDVGRLDVDDAVVHESGHQPLRVNPEVLRRDVFGCMQVDVVARPRDTLLFERHAHAHRAV